MSAAAQNRRPANLMTQLMPLYTHSFNWLSTASLGSWTHCRSKTCSWHESVQMAVGVRTLALVDGQRPGVHERQLHARQQRAPGMHLHVPLVRPDRAAHAARKLHNRQRLLLVLLQPGSAGLPMRHTSTLAQA